MPAVIRARLQTCQVWYKPRGTSALGPLTDAEEWSSLAHKGSRTDCDGSPSRNGLSPFGPWIKSTGPLTNQPTSASVGLMMRRAYLLVPFAAYLLTGPARGSRTAQEPAASALEEPTKKVATGSLKVCLRLEDQTAFSGVADARVIPDEGYEVVGEPGDAPSEIVFHGIAAGKYHVEVSAAGFLTVRLSVIFETSNEQKTVFVVMKPRSATNASPLVVKPLELPPIPEAKTTAKLEAPPETETETGKIPGAKEKVLPVDEHVACPVEQVLKATGENVREFVNSMEKFTATELVEHYAIDKSGDRKTPDKRKFEYVVVVTGDRTGIFWLEEYRNGSSDQEQFPAHLATLGLPAIVLLFHPEFAADFKFQCEGLVRDEGRAYWQVRFDQRKDRPARIESYRVNGRSFPVYLRGRAWIDPGKAQVVWLESELAEPIPQIGLTEQHKKIQYTGVKFASTAQEIWLPQSAEVYAERRGKKYYRKHSFGDFRLFNVDTAQNQKTPNGSYSISNLTDSDVTCELIVTAAEGLAVGPITLRFVVPARGTVVKTVGNRKDVNLPIEAVRSAKFVHSGGTGAVKVDADLPRETTVDVIPAGTQE